MVGQHIVTVWAQEYAQLELRLADVISERDAYQEIARAALDQLHSIVARVRATTRRYR
jgi:hypothetical protein